ncbi:universal stress protein [Furfurilactobacillus curtus]
MMTFKPQQILVPLDGSENSEQALAVAVDIAQQFDSRLHLIRVYNPAFASAAVDVSEAVKGFDNNMIMEGKRYLEAKVVQLSEKGVSNVENHLVQGNVKKTIAIDYPQAHQIDLIVIGATGLDTFSQAVLGSVTGYVVNRATANVMVVKKEPTTE